MLATMSICNTIAIGIEKIDDDYVWSRFIGMEGSDRLVRSRLRYDEYDDLYFIRHGEKYYINDFIITNY